jgi:hypothetical protein
MSDLRRGGYGYRLLNAAQTASANLQPVSATAAAPAAKDQPVEVN